MIQFSDLKIQNEDAFTDFIYFWKQGDTSFHRHLKIWQEVDGNELTQECVDYKMCLVEIANKLQTN